jgi:hypothetical protein
MTITDDLTWGWVVYVWFISSAYLCVDLTKSELGKTDNLISELVMQACHVILLLLQVSPLNFINFPKERWQLLIFFVKVAYLTF